MSMFHEQHKRDTTFVENNDPKKARVTDATTTGSFVMTFAPSEVSRIGLRCDRDLVCGVIISYCKHLCLRVQRQVWQCKLYVDVGKCNFPLFFFFSFFAKEQHFRI